MENFKYSHNPIDRNDRSAMVQSMEEHGFVLIKNVISDEDIISLKESVDRLYPIGLDYCKKTDHFKCIFNRDRLFLDLLDKEPVIGLLEDLLGDDCHIIGQSAWKSGLGHNGWFPHTDRTFVEFPEHIYDHSEFKLPIYLCTAHLYLTDITKELAPTYIIPGSHKSGKSLNGEDNDPIFKGKRLEPVICQKGDVLIFRSDLWHTGSANTSEEIRYLVQTHYSRRCIAQQFSPYMKFQFAPHIIEIANDRQRRLLGNHTPSAYD